MSKVIRVEQRLQDPPQFFFLPADEAIVAIIPCVLGLMSKKVFVGIGLTIVAYLVWKRIKGERGLTGLLALLYWIIPSEVSPYRALPDSAVSTWRA
ncbi:type IV conjugative transfer system protein TraL [Pukyongiella litopenaei]|uniref:Type IV conjugative transfer system protein TraL n=1 Tax=Pukyongiella litopenaei TaxID=2605946 RepID=A0A5C2H1W3_9RHOB|nr:type IV conjugative transfer system protein TraL [Pukyongiella litopenaei]QEP30437.1 type IV conjugative transfer system protein TraL [Pukyongiella litopenaei]